MRGFFFSFSFLGLLFFNIINRFTLHKIDHFWYIRKQGLYFAPKGSFFCN